MSQQYKSLNNSPLISIRLLLSGIIALVFFVLPVQADTLQAIQSKISNLRAQISGKESQRNQVRAQIQERDVKIDAILQKIQKARAERIRINQNISDLETRQITLNDSKQVLQSALMTQLEAAYKTGKQSRIKMLLSQKNPEIIGRLLGYHNYLHIAREQKINELQNTIESLKELEADIKKQTWQLSVTEEELRREQKVLAKAKNEKNRLLGKIDKEINSKTSDIQRLIKEQEKVRNLMAKLESERRVEAPIVNPAASGTFGSNKGRLVWPSKGKVIHQYNSIISGDIRRPGIFIKANEGSSVRAIYDGKVVYSDQFQKKGLMTIISHGDGYMSLYAHNKTLFRNVGDRVKAGEKIALSGDSGNTLTAGLYFEIRKNGKPLNPRSWLSR